MMRQRVRPLTKEEDHQLDMLGKRWCECGCGRLISSLSDEQEWNVFRFQLGGPANLVGVSHPIFYQAGVAI